MDAVNHPSHYKRLIENLEMEVRDAICPDIDPINLECFEAMTSMLSIEEMRGYLRGNSFKYRWRYQQKAGVQDLKKARWYESKLERLEEVVSEHS